MEPRLIFDPLVYAGLADLIDVNDALLLWPHNLRASVTNPVAIETLILFWDYGKYPQVTASRHAPVLGNQHPLVTLFDDNPNSPLPPIQRRP